MITRKFHSTSHAKLAMFLVLMFPFALVAQQNQNTTSSTNSNALTAANESKNDAPKEQVSTVKQGTQKAASDELKAVVLNNVEPSYTDAARKHKVKGVVTLKVILRHNGEIDIVQVVKGLRHGLTEKAIEAARKIKFIPATKNGRPVSQYVVLRFVFSVY